MGSHVARLEHDDLARGEGSVVLLIRLDVGDGDLRRGRQLVAGIVPISERTSMTRASPLVQSSAHVRRSSC